MPAVTSINITLNPSAQEMASRFGSIKLQGFLRNQIKKLAFLVEREAKKVTPVRTGRLRASVRVEPMVKPLEAIIQPHTDYAIFVHEGTRFMRARPFMFWGAESAVKGYEQRVAKDLDEMIQSKIT